MQIKKFLLFKKHLLNNFIKIQGVQSINLVGSFWKNPVTSNYRDIDIVIVLDSLNLKKFNGCEDFIKKINLSKYGLKKYKIKINNTFGPLKFDIKNHIVFHLMVYDLKSHYAHAVRSPFTCLDWERTKTYKGKSLKTILTPNKLQFKDFFSSRRGTEEYLKDMARDNITYREYFFSKKKIFLKKKKFKIKAFEKKEFYYHISKNLIFNYYKLIKQKNILPNKTQYDIILKKIFKQNKLIINRFHLLFTAKNKNLDLNIMIYSIWIKKFVKIFQKHLIKEEKSCKKIFFLRHGKTKLNDNSFLGVLRDPGIINNKIFIKKIKKFKTENISMIFSSKLSRATQTAKSISSKKIIINNMLNEKNYGEAEGLNYLKLSKKFPYIIKAWNKKKDPKFPNGESDKNVLIRINNFKKTLSKILIKKNLKGTLAVVTHNVVLRCLIGNEFKIPKSLWYKINIEHLEKIEFIYYQGKILPNINREKFLGGILK